MLLCGNCCRRVWFQGLNDGICWLLQQMHPKQFNNSKHFVRQRLRWFRHVERMIVDQIPHNALHARFEVNRNEGRPRSRWIDNIKEDIASLGLILRGAMHLNKERGWWRSVIRIRRRQMAGIRNWWWNILKFPAWSLGLFNDSKHMDSHTTPQSGSSKDITESLVASLKELNVKTQNIRL